MSFVVKEIYLRPKWKLAHVAGPSVYSCGIRGMRAAKGRVLHKEKRTHHF